jgi:hypothetical protein
MRRKDMRPWKKGWYGDPCGVPDGIISRALRKYLLRRVGDDVNEADKTVVDVLVEAMVQHAMRGNLGFLRMIFEWCDGPLDRVAWEYEAHPRIPLKIVPAAPPRVPAEIPARAGDSGEVAGTDRPQNLLTENGEQKGRAGRGFAV